jgi:hypothetical protein
VVNDLRFILIAFLLNLSLLSSGCATRALEQQVRQLQMQNQETNEKLARLSAALQSTNPFFNVQPGKNANPSSPPGNLQQPSALPGPIGRLVT